MDRSFLSDNGVIEASRDFVCVRPQTYEDKAEAEVLSYVYAGRSGLENTSFALLDPQGKKLTRGGRSPKNLYGTPERFAEALTELSAKYKGAKPVEALPAVRDLRLALNVAAADMRPLVVVRGKDAKSAEALAESVAVLSWSEGVIGRAHYVVLKEGETFEGLEPPLGVSLIQPDPYGLGGEVLVELPAKVKAKTLASDLGKAIGEYSVEAREHSDHVREARRKGIDWESEIPVTDSGKKGRRRR